MMFLLLRISKAAMCPDPRARAIYHMRFILRRVAGSAARRAMSLKKSVAPISSQLHYPNGLNGRRGMTVDWRKLAEWMDAKRLGSGPIRDAVPLAGGTQNVLVRFVRGDDPRGYVLRCPPPNARPEANEAMRREARVLAALAGTTVPHPGLIAACDEETVLGTAFYLMEPVEGANPVTGLPALYAGSPQARHALGLALVDGIALLGALDYRALGLDGFGKPEGYLARQVERWERQLAGYAALPGWPGRGALPDVDRLARWIEANRPADTEPGLLHGDFHLANVMVRADTPALAAIVDWELATIGDPLVDLGWLLATWPEPDGSGGTMTVEPWDGCPAADELIARYAAGSARDVSAVGWYRVLAAYKLGILLEGTHARACAGRAPVDVGDRLHRRAVHLFERARGWIGI
jgi:aminoglycoside phosphotransferase (APT) family kinase protein